MHHRGNFASGLTTRQENIMARRVIDNIGDPFRAFRVVFIATSVLLVLSVPLIFMMPTSAISSVRFPVLIRSSFVCILMTQLQGCRVQFDGQDTIL